MSLNPMENEATVIALRQFTPTGDEGRDVTTLYELIDRLGGLKTAPAIRDALIGIFERHPKADLGSPGPIVHALEEAPLDEHVRLLVGSLGRNPSSMAVWMSDRCFRSPGLSQESRAALLKALRDAQATVNNADTAAMLADTLDEYGT
jgi:hypothetical protein